MLESEPCDDNEQAESYLSVGQFRRYDVDTLVVSPDESTTVQVGKICMFGVGLLDGFAWEMAEYHGEKTADPVQYFRDEPLNYGWGSISARLEKRLSMGGGYATSGFILRG